MHSEYINPFLIRITDGGRGKRHTDALVVDTADGENVKSGEAR